MTTATANETDSVPRINDTAPDFTAETTQGTIHFHDWIGDGWAILFSHPKDFTPVCTTELGYMAKLQPEFAKRNVKIIGLSVDPVTNHSKWAADIEETQGAKVNYPMIGDPQLKIAKLYGMLPAEAGETCEGRTPADNATVRTVFVVGPDKKIKLQLSYPMTTGRNFDEILRVIDSMQLTAKHKVATPVNWKPGRDVIITGAVSNEEARRSFPASRRSSPICEQPNNRSRKRVRAGKQNTPGAPFLARCMREKWGFLFSVKIALKLSCSTSSEAAPTLPVFGRVDATDAAGSRTQRGMLCAIHPSVKK